MSLWSVKRNEISLLGLGIKKRARVSASAAAVLYKLGYHESHSGVNGPIFDTESTDN